MDALQCVDKAGTCSCHWASCYPGLEFVCVEQVSSTCIKSWIVNCLCIPFHCCHRSPCTFIRNLVLCRCTRHKQHPGAVPWYQSGVNFNLAFNYSLTASYHPLVMISLHSPPCVTHDHYLKNLRNQQNKNVTIPQTKASSSLKSGDFIGPGAVRKK